MPAALPLKVSSCDATSVAGATGFDANTSKLNLCRWLRVMWAHRSTGGCAETTEESALLLLHHPIVVIVLAFIPVMPQCDRLATHKHGNAHWPDTLQAH